MSWNGEERRAHNREDMRSLWEALKELQKQQHSIDISIAESTPVRHQILEVIQRLEKKFEKIDVMEKTMLTIDNRVAKIEDAEVGRKKTVETVVKAAITSIVCAIGSFLYWAVKSLIITLK